MIKDSLFENDTYRIAIDSNDMVRIFTPERDEFKCKYWKEKKGNYLDVIANLAHQLRMVKITVLDQTSIIKSLKEELKKFRK